MQEDTIVVRSAGKLIPDDYLNLVITDCNCFGMATIKDNKLAIERMVFSKTEPFTLTEFKTYQDTFLNSTAVYWFGFGERPDDCIQPYDTLVGSDNKPILTIFMEGDYSSFHKTDSTLTEDYFAATEHVIPTIKKSFKLADQKLDGLLNELNDAITKRSLVSAITETGAMTLVSTDWEPESFTKGTVGSAFPWGWVSRTHDYVETPPAKPEAAPTLTGRRRVLSSTTAAAPAEPIKPLKEQATEGAKMLSDIEAAEQENEERGRAETEHEMIGPPEDVQGKRRKSWFAHNCEYIPTNWHLPGANAPAKKKSFTELSKPKGEIIVTNERVPTPATGPKQPDKAVPAISEDRVAKLKVHLETLDRNSQLMDVDPKQMQAAEAKHGDFFSKMGKAPDYADFKPYEWFVAVGDHSVDDLALLAWTAIRAKVVVENDLDLATQPAGAGPKAQPVVAEPVKPAVELERPVRRAVRR